MTKLSNLLPAFALLAGCAGNKPPALLIPSRDAPRLAINKATRQEAPNGTASRAPVSSAPVWHIQRSDHNVAQMLSRWGKDAGWTVYWNDAPEVPITGSASVEKPDFLSAADVVLTDVKFKGYPIGAKAYVDKVLEVRREEVR